MTRELAWEACVNVRDLGGLPTAGGAVTRSGSIVRSDTVRGLTLDGWAALSAYGIATIVDLRSPDEVAADRSLRDGSDWLVDGVPAESPAERHVRTVGAPLLGAWTRELEAFFDRVAAAEADPVGSTRAVYLAILGLFSANVAAALTAIADAPEGGVLVHCQAGKDRTGTICALVLMLAEVEAESIADDYALSGPNIAPLHDVWVNEAPDEAERDRRRRIGLAPRQAMLDVIGELEARWGGVEGYLRAAGVSTATLSRLRRRIAD